MATDPTHDGDARANEAVAWYYRQCEAGTPPAAGEFLARFPDVRGQLEAFLADKAAFDHAVGHDPNATLAPLPVPAIGERIRFVGDYELLGEIARGGMGVVFHAKQVSLNREVAVKMILAGELAGQTAVQRFRAEAEAAANLDHPHILPIYEVGEHHGQPYFSMKLVGGGSFADKLTASPRANVRGNVATLALIARAVHFAHQRGILHRDLKPANVLLDADGTPFVTDFGLAKRTGDSSTTQTGAVVGTPSYMPPEQARGEKGLTVAADVYALGAMLYEVLTGRPPFRAGTVMDTLLQVLEKEPEYPVGTDRDLAAVALKCLSKKPGDRYASAAELADDLDRWAAGEPIRARPVGKAVRLWRWARRNQAVASLATTVFGLTVVAVTGIAVGYSQTSAALADAERQLRVTRTVVADRESADQNFGRAERLLTDIPAADREWEWHWLNRRVHPEWRLIRPDIGANLYSATAVAGGTRVAVGSFNGVTEFDVDTGARTAERKFEKGNWYDELERVAVSADGRVVAGGSRTAVTVWRPDGAVITIPVENGPMVVAVSSDGRLVAAGGDGRNGRWAGRGADPENKPVRVWDTASGALTRTLGGLTTEATSLAFRPGTGELVACSRTEVVVWDTATGGERFRLDPRETSGAGGVVYSPDGKTLLVGRLDAVNRHDADTGKLRDTLAVPAEVVRTRSSPHYAEHMAVRGDGRVLATAGRNNREIHAWDLAAGKWLTRLVGHTGSLTGVSFTSSGRVATTAFQDETIHLWDVPPEDNPRRLAANPKSIVSLTYSPDGSALASGDEDGVVRVTDAATGSEKWTAKGTDGLRANAVSISPDGRWLAVGEANPAWAGGRGQGAAGRVRVYDAATGEPGVELQTGSSPSGFPAVAFDPRGGRVAVAGGGDGVAIYDTTDGQRIRRMPFASPTTGAISISPDKSEAWTVAYAAGGRHVVSANYWIAEIVVWDADTGAVVARHPREGRGNSGAVERLVVAADGRTLAAFEASTVRLLDLQTGRDIGRANDLGISTLAMHPAGRRLFVGGDRGDLIDVAAAQPVFRFPPGYFTAAAFHPDGGRLAVADRGTVWVYDASPRDAIPDPPRPVPSRLDLTEVLPLVAAGLVGAIVGMLAVRWVVLRFFRLLPRVGYSAGRAARWVVRRSR